MPPALTALAGRLEVRAAVVFLALRAVSGVLLAVAAHDQVWFEGITGPREGDVDLALSWDGQWYRRIAEDGYPDQLPVGPDGRVLQNPWAFYPLFPLTARVVGAVLGTDFSTVAPVLALLAGTAAAVLMARLLADTLPGGEPAAAGPAPGHRARATAAPESLALAAVAVWAAFPTSPVLQMAYTESFSVLLLVAYLLLLVRERWWWAGATALLLGVTRPIALPLLVVALVAVAMRWRARRERPLTGRERAGALAALAGTGLSGVLWTAVAWAGTGERDAYPRTMTAWRGDDAIDVLEPWVRTFRWAWEYHWAAFVWPSLGIGLAALLSLATLVPRVAPGIDLRLRVWCVTYSFYLLAVVDGNTSVLRYLVPLFPLALVLVGAHRPHRRGTASGASRWWGARTAFWVAAGVAGQVGWIWWLVLFTPPADFPP